MSKTERLKELVSHYWQLPLEGDEDWETPLTQERLKNFSSLRLLRFFASVEERLDVSIEDPDAITSFKDLLRLIDP